MTDRDFADATVLVTGAASGIGLAAARRLAAGGARLILMDRDAAGLAEFAGARTLVGELADEGLWDGAELAGLTHAVLNAGIARGGSAIADTPFEDWRAVLATNLDGTFLSLRASLRALRGGGRGGAVVLLSSAAGLKAKPGAAAYAISKAALIHLARVAAVEGAPDRIRVNAVAPAGVETPIWTSQPFFRELAAERGGEAPAFRSIAAADTLLGRFARPAEVAEQIAFLLSDRAALVTGTCFVADGGYTL